MFRRNSKTTLHVLTNSFAVLFVLVGLCGFAHAQSQDPANPTPITSNIVSGQAGSLGATYYYRFQAPKGSTTITLTGQTNNYSAQFEADLLNVNGVDLGDIYVSAGDKAQSASKQLSLDSAQPVTIVVKLTKDSTLKWQKYTIKISGAVVSGNSGGNSGDSGSSSGNNGGSSGNPGPRKRKNPPASLLPDLKVMDVQIGGKGGNTAIITIANVCNGDVPASTSIRVKMVIYKGADKASGVDYYVYGNLAPLQANTKSKIPLDLASYDKVKSFNGRYLRVEVDPENTIKETIEDNNWWETAEAPFPDPSDACSPKPQ